MTIPFPHPDPILDTRRDLRDAHPSSGPRFSGPLSPAEGGPAAFLLEQLLEILSRLEDIDPGLPPEDSPIGRATREFFANSWEDAQEFLAKTRKVRVVPRSLPAPNAFRFEMDCRYKRKPPGGSVELVDGTLSGSIHYRSDLLLAPQGEPAMLVRIRRDPALLHPNFSRAFGILCLGDVPPGPFLLSDLIEHVYSILTFQNFSNADAADAEAALFFSRAPDAFDGLFPADPLY
jgi:hypothetical protein